MPPTTTTTVADNDHDRADNDRHALGGHARASGPRGCYSPTTVTTSGAGVGPGRSTPAVLATLGPSILGRSVLSRSQILGWFASTGAVANVTVPFSWIVNDYVAAGKLTGVRADIAFAQSIVETGYFSFPSGGQDKRSYNNFAGIGACDSCKRGWSFPTPVAGVMAQEQLLSDYATPPQFASFSGGPIGGVGIDGCCTTWMGLSGVWASNTAYGYEILTVYKEMLDWALQQELKAVGLQEGAGTPFAGPGTTSAPPAEGAAWSTVPTAPAGSTGSSGSGATQAPGATEPAALALPSPSVTQPAKS